MNIDHEQPTDRRVRPRREDVRARILDAATHEFEYHGYSTTTVSMVAQRAGFTKGAVYSNFAGKPALFAATALAKLANESLPAVEAALPSLDGPQDAAETIQVVSRIVADTVLDGPQRWYILLNEFRVTGLGDPAAREAYAQVQSQRVEALYGLVAPLPVMQRFSRPRLKRILRVLVGLLDSIVMERITQPDVLDRRTIQALAAACLSPLLDPERAPSP